VNGLASQQVFLAGLLEKYGIGVQVTKAGRYKSAVEAFTDTQMSTANRQQTEELLIDLWREVVLRVSESRGIPPQEIQRLTDERGFINRDLALESGLVDRIGYFDEVLEELRAKVGGKPGKIFPQITLADYSGIVVKPSAQAGAKGNQIAILYMEGDIVDGEGSSGSVGGDRFAREIRRLRTDGSVHAIVVRVNSPGGSVTAAETIQRELALARDVMPVIVSCGSYAASGGYWVATEADQIFAQPNTVTGSIGVFGILPNVQELANRHGVTFDTVRTGTYADLFSMVRPKTEEEMELIQDVVDEIYVDFVTRVAKGRDMTVETAESLAQGRVWSGEQALENGLVDQIGGLNDAVRFAAQAAGLEKWELYEFPRPVEFAEVLADLMAPQQAPLVRYPMQDFVREIQGEVRALQFMNDPRGIYARMPYSLRIQ
jgi:protease-4